MIEKVVRRHTFEILVAVMELIVTKPRNNNFVSIKANISHNRCSAIFAILLEKELAEIIDINGHECYVLTAKGIKVLWSIKKSVADIKKHFPESILGGRFL